MTRLNLLGVLALTGVSALQIPLLQRPIAAPKLPWSFHDDKAAASGKPVVESDALQSKISAERLMSRAEDLYEIAKMSEDEYNHPTRVIGSRGHLATLTYIRSALSNLDGFYNVTDQTLYAVSGAVFEARLVIGDKLPKSASPMYLSPPTPNKQPVFADVILVENSGCHASDYPDSVEGSIALIQRGDCSFGAKSAQAGKSGAVAAVIYNNEDGEFFGSLETGSSDHVPTWSLSAEEGAKIAKKLKHDRRLTGIAYMDSYLNSIKTTNLIAQTVEGDPENCVMAGGHSDSVDAGPGINDDGSGSLSILEVATHLAQFSVNNCVRFAWWSAEEEGLIGSNAYVASLSEEENKKIRVFMDYDMMASPNFAYQVYNATNKDSPTGSEELRDLYVDWYEKQGLNYTFIPFDGRSDYVGFIRAAIPAGGIATGAEGIKTEEEEAMFGGKKGDWYDPCYHQLCDDLKNVDMEAWEVNTKLIAHSVATYAKSFEGFPERTDDVSVKSYGDDIKYRGPRLVM